ncbi:single-stranded DNA-binding protein [Sphaerochaeta globosa]|uniref:Single-stranded DNA-binding protein n=1 Tax=Sphaerochaeta globosa (strain ATCC BAA-1886 / DSM 22777 / Buddy) TaxID=158189 RepID=F0RWM7_SPHGB|nr:single-stranded DNA-binding protein [Sphaerochaeta globosa]ADY13658.1 single-strand binding protein [Sphaerochaeta globosa str. Buddy]
MADMCSIMITGRLTADSEIKYAGQTPILKFSVAVGRYDKGQTTSSFFDVVQFSRAAEGLTGKLTRGKPVVVRGEMRQEFWSANDGSKRSRWVLVADSFGVQPLGGGQEDRYERGEPTTQNMYSSLDDDGDDIPF